MSSLYTINQELIKYIDSLWEDITEDELSTVQELQMAKDDKLTNIHQYILNLENENQILDNEIERLQKIKKPNSSKIEYLKNLVNTTLDGEAWKYDLWWFSYRKSESLDIINPDTVPDEFKTTETIEKIDKNAIKKAMKEGQTVPWVDIIYKQNLQIK